MRTSAPTPVSLLRLASVRRVASVRAAAPHRSLRLRAVVEVLDSSDDTDLVRTGSATSEGLAISGAVLALNGSLANFSVREDVAVSRTEENGRTTVTIKVGSRNWADSSVTSGYLLPTVGPVDDGEEARAKAAALEEELRRVQAEVEEAARRKAALEAAQRSSNAGLGTRVALSPESLARLSAQGGMQWSKDGDGLDASYSFFNIYRSGETLEAVQATADSAFTALAAWLKEQQALVEMNFMIERDRLQRAYEAEKAEALAALQAELEARFQAQLSAELDKLRYELEVAKQTALDKLRAEAAAATAAALARQEAELRAAFDASVTALTAGFEAQMEGLRAQMAALEEKYARELNNARILAAEEKRAALEKQKRAFLAKYELVRSQLADALELSIDGALSRIGEIRDELKAYQAEAEKADYN